jgi:hypothetical protein
MGAIANNVATTAAKASLNIETPLDQTDEIQMEV